MKKKTKIVIGSAAVLLIAAGIAGYKIVSNMGMRGGNFTMTSSDIEKLTKDLTTELTDEQKADPISKYYHETPVPPADNILNDLEAPLTDDKLVAPEDLDYFLDPENTLYNGYGVLENGVAYAATETVMDGVTRDMYNFYDAWSSSQGDRELIYKIWYPGYHYTQTENMVLVEDIGQGEEVIQFMQGKVSFDEQLVTKNELDMYVISAKITPASGGDDMRSILMHARFENADGDYVDRCIAWFGCYWDNGKVVVDLTGVGNAMDRARGMAYHSAGENANLASVIKEVYADEKDNFDPSAVKSGRGNRGRRK